MSEQALQKWEGTGQQVAVVPQQTGGIIRLADKLDAVVDSFKEYSRACEALLTSDDYQGIAGRRFKKKSAWRKIATAFNVSTRIVSSKVEYDEEDRIHHAEFIVEAFAPNGRTTQAWAGASRVDRDYSHDQDVAATAQTRATNRAIADLIGCGEVSAEEMLDAKEQQRAQAPAAKLADQPPQTITGARVLIVAEKSGTSKKTGKPWTAFFVKFTDGETELDAGTFDTKLADAAKALEANEGQATITIKPGKLAGKFELVSIEPMVPAPVEEPIDVIP